MHVCLYVLNFLVWYSVCRYSVCRYVCMSNFCFFTNQPTVIHQEERTPFSNHFYVLFVWPLVPIERIEPGGPWDTSYLRSTRFVDWLAGRGLLTCRSAWDQQHPAAVRMVRHVATRRHSLRRRPILLHHSDRVRVASVDIESPMDWTELFLLQDCTVCTIHTYKTIGHIIMEGGYNVLPPSLLISTTCVFFLFGLQASLSAERALSAFQCLLHRLFWKPLLRIRLFLAVFHLSRLLL